MLLFHQKSYQQIEVTLYWKVMYFICKFLIFYLFLFIFLGNDDLVFTGIQEEKFTKQFLLDLGSDQSSSLHTNHILISKVFVVWDYKPHLLLCLFLRIAKRWMRNWRIKFKFLSGSLNSLTCNSPRIRYESISSLLIYRLNSRTNWVLEP